MRCPNFRAWFDVRWEKASQRLQVLYRQCMMLKLSSSVLPFVLPIVCRLHLLRLIVFVRSVWMNVSLNVCLFSATAAGCRRRGASTQSCSARDESAGLVRASATRTRTLCRSLVLHALLLLCDFLVRRRGCYSFLTRVCLRVQALESKRPACLPETLQRMRGSLTALSALLPPNLASSIAEKLRGHTPRGIS